MRRLGLSDSNWRGSVARGSVGHGFSFRGSFGNFFSLFRISGFFEFSIDDFGLDFDLSNEFVLENEGVLGVTEFLPTWCFHPQRRDL